MWITRLLKKWHVLHSWEKWIFDRKEYTAYIWTPPGCYTHITEYWHRTCSACGTSQTKTVIPQ
jgi:hypothetical protein